MSQPLNYNGQGSGERQPGFMVGEYCQEGEDVSMYQVIYRGGR